MAEGGGEEHKCRNAVPEQVLFFVCLMCPFRVTCLQVPLQRGKSAFPEYAVQLAGIGGRKAGDEWVGVSSFVLHVIFL